MVEDADEDDAPTGLYPVVKFANGVERVVTQRMRHAYGMRMACGDAACTRSIVT